MLLELVPEGFEERSSQNGLELVAYVGRAGENQLRRAFGDVRAADVNPGWAEAWRRFHQPVTVGPLWVGPPWLDPEPGMLAVVIDPGRAFGTGAHATTRLCLGLLLELDPTSVADLGCGSGVLAIAAAKLGFAPVVAIDRDEIAVEAARTNAGVNGVSIDVRAGDVLVEPTPETELALANLELRLVEQVARLARGRVLIASGYPAADRPRLGGWRRRERRELDGWVAELFTRDERAHRRRQRPTTVGRKGTRASG